MTWCVSDRRLVSGDGTPLYEWPSPKRTCYYAIILRMGKSGRKGRWYAEKVQFLIRFSLSKVQEEACNQPVAEPMLAPDTDQDDQGVEEWQLAEESPTSRTLSDRCNEAPSTPTNRAYRRAALRCMEKLRQM
ncbi:hypothetical protein HF086_007584 [Spodoptera exigua]|uniref:Uncharacterized protein n=1 Tax=Spodoptera exigua TaxID=7107 RepID=A0A922SLA9_SPOEX|nr:hypothetical protein HF086_007584 [Spodoptera exigua]